MPDDIFYPIAYGILPQPDYAIDGAFAVIGSEQRIFILLQPVLTPCVGGDDNFLKKYLYLTLISKITVRFSHF